MLKKIIPAIAMTALFSTVHASTHVIEGWYAAGSIGKLYYNNFEESHKNTVVAGSVGYKMYSFRIEGQYSYLNLDSYYRKSSYNSLAVNGFLDYDTSTIFSPYIGIGLIGSEIKTNKYYFGSSQSNKMDVDILLGTRIYATNNVALDVGYKTNFSRNGVASLGLVYQF